MPQIGQFTRTPGGYSGRLRTLWFDCELTFVTADNADSDNAPAYRVHLASLIHDDAVGRLPAQA